MFRPSRVRYVLPAVFGCLLLLFPAVCPGGVRALGLVRSSHDASLGGSPVTGSEVIFDGDLLTTSSGGNALLELPPGTRVSIPENSSVRFARDGDTVRADLLSGAVVSETAGKPALIVATPKYEFAPAPDRKCRYLVQLSKEQATVAAAINGSVIVMSGHTNASYVLREGKYVAISASAIGMPGQAAAAGPHPEPRHAGTVRNVAPEAVVQRQGQGGETALNGDDGINTGDIVTTRQSGRVQMVLSDGSLLNIGSGSVVTVETYRPRPHQAQVGLNSGHVHVWVAKLSEPGSSWTVKTPTAAAEVAGAEIIIEAQPGATSVYCLDGLASVQNVDPSVTGHVILHAGQSTTVAQGAAPSAPQVIGSAVLQSQIDQTTAGPAVPGGPGQVLPATPEGWHIGSLSEAASAGLIVGATVGAAAAITIPLAIASPSAF